MSSVTTPSRLSAIERVHVAGFGGMLTALKANNIRADKVASVRSQIAAGTYETEGKLDIAAERLLNSVVS